MGWTEIPKIERDAVVDVLRREAERREQEAERLRDAAATLQRPSLIEASELGASAFWAAIEWLESPERAR